MRRHHICFISRGFIFPIEAAGERPDFDIKGYTPDFSSRLSPEVISAR